MHAIVAKYMHFICIAVFFDNVSCDQISVGASKADYTLLGETACTAECMTKQQNMTFQALEECYGNCSRTTITRELREDAADDTHTLKLHCREDKMMKVEIEQKPKRNATESDELRLYVLKVQEAGKTSAPTISIISDSPIVKIENLAASTQYNVTAAVVTSNYVYSYAPDVATFHTLRTDFMPGNIHPDHITLQHKIDKQHPKLVEIDVSWTPAVDMTCSYDVLFHSTVNHDIYTDLLTRHVKGFHTTIKNTTYGAGYKVAVVGRNPIKGSLRSTALFTSITLPSCLNATNNNLTICPPHQPFNIKIDHERLSKNSFNLNVTWDPPPTMPDHYTVVFYTEHQYEQQEHDQPGTEQYSETKPPPLESPGISSNVSGDMTYAYFENVAVSGMDNYVKVTSHSAGGSEYDEQHFNLYESYTSFWDKYELQFRTIKWLIMSLICVSITLVVIGILYRRIQRKRMKEEHLMKYQSKEVYLRELASTYNSDEMEMDAKNVRLYDVLGEGAFGVVRRGLILPGGQDVAVKMLKDTATVDDVEGFLQEIALIRSVGKHRNIVGIIGHCTVVYSEMMLLTEYCSEGNLLNYLRNAWQELLAAYREHKANIKCIEVEDPHTHITLNEKLSEDSLNLNSSMSGKQMFKLNNIADGGGGSVDEKVSASSNVTAAMDPLCRPIVVVNRAYDYENNNQYLNNFRREPPQPKCRVEIVTNGLNDLTKGDIQRKCMVKIKNIEDQRDASEPKSAFLIVENRGYDALSSAHTEEARDALESKHLIVVRNRRGKKPLESSDLLNFAKQIATGMDFLAKEKIVHRDLAARNVLVCSDKTVKIADFGLSRDIYQDNIYLKSSAGKLPVKWLALESMLQQHYTTQSDVWSYGILLYEIVTLGNIPYPTTPVEYLVSYLKAGHRMSRPTNCSEEFYRLMHSCWNADPSKRPQFSEITDKLESFLTNYNADELINISFSEPNGRVKEDCVRIAVDSTSSYLKPI